MAELDVAVSGAGSAGSTARVRLAKNGKKVDRLCFASQTFRSRGFKDTGGN